MSLSIYFFLVICFLGVFSNNLEIYINQMATEMSDHAVRTALEVTGISSDPKEVSNKISDEFIKRFGGKWQCLVSKSEVGVSANLSHESGTLISFRILSSYITLFKASESMKENCKNETTLVDNALSCTHDDKCSLKIIEKALSNINPTSFGGYNFKIDGGKIVSVLNNGSAKNPLDFIDPIVVDCAKKFNTTSFNSTFGFFTKFNSCIRTTFEEKVEDKGWTCFSGINSIFGVDSFTYFAELYYIPLTVGVYK